MKVVEWLTSHRAIVECDKCSSHIELSTSQIDVDVNFCSDECRDSYVRVEQPNVYYVRKQRKKRRKQSFYERYQLSSTFDEKTLFLSYRRTFDRLKKYNKRSMYELIFIDACLEAFGSRDVVGNVLVNDWTIDVYVKSIDAYAQVFSVYWHGLDRSLESIKEFKNPRDATIYETYLRDQQQEEWFKSNQKTLIRFTDKEILQWLKEKKLVEEIKSRILSMKTSAET